MGELQWALLIVCVVLVIILYVLSRRGANEVVEDEDKYNPLSKRDSGDQMDLLSSQSDGGFDEFGVGKKRTVSNPKAARVAPGTDAAAGRGGREPPEPSVATLLNPLPGQTTEPRKKAAEKKKAAAAAAQAAAAPSASRHKALALILAHTEENDIEGPALHAALKEQGLRFGEGQVYHRMIGGESVFAFASLIKPGTLIPEEAESFSTKGLTVVLNLPGPVKPLAALDDMMETTIAVAKALKLGIFDAQRQPLSASTGAAMRAEVEQWAKDNDLD